MRLKSLLYFLLYFLPVITAAAQDTIIVQTLTFDSITTRRGTWQFPESGTFRKILMYHTLKCDSRTTHDQYDCGEWDYLTYNIVHQHTGKYDSIEYFHPNFTLIEGTSRDSLLLSDTPTFHFREYIHRSVMYPDTVLRLQTEFPNSGLQASEVIPNHRRAGRSQFLWRPEELTAQGLTAGPITSITLPLSSGAGASIGHLMVRMAGVIRDSLAPETLVEDLDTVFFRTVQAEGTELDLDFCEPFSWDGESGIVIDLSFTNPAPGQPVVILAEEPDFAAGITASTDGFALDLDGVSDFLKIPEDTYFNSDFTFETWFLKRNNNNWSRIFDFGNGPGEENVIVVLSKETTGKLSFHINKDGLGRSFELSDPTPLNEWTHLTLRLTGNIGWAYINGNLVKYGLLQTPPDFSRSVNYIGRSNWNSDRMADVLLDEFRLFRVALDPGVILDHFRKELTDPLSDPNLVLYYKFDEEGGLLAVDSASGGRHARFYGYPSRYPVQGSELAYGFRSTPLRPGIIFERLESSGPQVTTETLRESTENAPLQIVLFDNTETPTIPTDTITAWEAGFQPVYSHHTIVDSVWTEPGTILRKILHSYFGEPFEIIDNYEIGRFITPYGIGLSLGPGFTWVYDVTDYAPLLRGEVDLSAGNQQELIDLKFLFIEGTPPRNVLKIDRVWGGLNSFYYRDLDDDRALPATRLALHPDGRQFRVKTRLTGHGHNSNTGEYPHCCEWKDNEHYLSVDGQQAAAWHIFQYHDCGLNPVYPQGGTWPGAREGWCPGDRVNDHDYEISSMIAGDSVTLDYDLTPVPPDNLGMGWGNYVVNFDLIHYGANHFENDAEIYEVISPATTQDHSRRNPVCEGVTLLLRNNGTAPLSSATFTYGIQGGPQQQFEWTGSLNPHSLDTLTLPVPGYEFWIGDGSGRFTASVSLPNGMEDQYADNNTFSTGFHMPDLINIPVVLALKTNKQAYRYELEVRDITGNVILRRDALENTALYLDTLDLPFGCYTIELTDAEDMGLSYWAYPSQGTGYFRILDLEGNILKNFHSEFGRQIFYTFHVGEGFYIPETGLDELLKIYPNPTDGIVNVEVPDLSGIARIRVIDPNGRIIYGPQDCVVSAKLDLSKFRAGVYLIEVLHNDYHILKKLVLH